MLRCGPKSGISAAETPPCEAARHGFPQAGLQNALGQPEVLSAAHFTSPKDAAGSNPEGRFEGKGHLQAVPRHREQWQWRGSGRNRGIGTGMTRPPPALAQGGQKARLFFHLWKVCPWGPKKVDEKAGSRAVDEIN